MQIIPHKIGRLIKPCIIVIRRVLPFLSWATRQIFFILFLGPVIFSLAMAALSVFQVGGTSQAIRLYVQNQAQIYQSAPPGMVMIEVCPQPLSSTQDTKPRPTVDRSLCKNEAQALQDYAHNWDVSLYKAYLSLMFTSLIFKLMAGFVIWWRKAQHLL